MLRERAARLHQWLHGSVRDARPGGVGGGRTHDVGVAGELVGTRTLRLAAQSGVEAAKAACGRLKAPSGGIDLVVVGGGVAGVSAALAARQLGFAVELFEEDRLFATLHGLPAAKPMHLVPELEGEVLRFHGATKEDLLEALEAQVASLSWVREKVVRIERTASGVLVHHGRGAVSAREVLVATGRGRARRLGVEGEELAHVEHGDAGTSVAGLGQVVVVGGGDAAVEAALRVDAAGCQTVLLVRGSSLRANSANQEALRASGVEVRFGAEVARVRPESVVLRGGEELAAEHVIVCVGRDASEALIAPHRRPDLRPWLAVLGVALAWLLVTWKSGPAMSWPGLERGGSLGGAVAILQEALSRRSFVYSLAYSAVVVALGVRRMRRRPTPYVRRQTAMLVAMQLGPLFVLPELLLPWLDGLGVFEAGIGRGFADAFFPVAEGGREWWRAYGFVLAWPLFFWNVFTSQPSVPWLALSFVQTFVLLPWLVLRWGKGAYCGTICSCGALAETAGDGLRDRMPKGEAWNRLQWLGQAALAACVAMLALRMLGWWAPGALGGWARGWLTWSLHGRFGYASVVDFGFAGVLGLGLYGAMSGRVWCRFGCPLAAWMHWIARFSRFRIRAEKSLCIECGHCSDQCHQGIDVMAHARRGVPVADVQCVRCSECVAGCPTGALTLGREARGVFVPDRVSARSDGKRRLPQVR